MTMTNRERAERCRQAAIAYSDDDAYTNLVDFLADSMHWCRINGREFQDALDTALMHFDAEIAGEDTTDDFHSDPTDERRLP